MVHTRSEGLSVAQKINNLLTLIIALIISIAILEVGLRTFTPFLISGVSNKVYHEKLGYVMNSNMAEIDEHGFRNNTLPSIDIVALGDSHTYGFNVSSDKSWPKLLAQKIKKHIYNFGVGGYGILQYQYLLNKAIELNPEVILLGLYLPNDLNDVCKLISTNQYWASRAKESGINSSLCPKTKKRQHGRSILKLLKEKSAIISIFSEYYSHLFPRRKFDLTNALMINDKKIKTVISHKRIRAHKRYMDINKPHIEMAYEILKNFFLEAKNNVKLNNMRFGVLFIPSKERVLYKHLIKMGYDIPIEYKELVGNEDELKENITLFLNNAGISSIDILQDMENTLLRHGNIYPASDNGHPIDMGYQIYAENAFKLYQQIIQDN